MPPEERAALERARRSATIGLVVVSVASLVVVAASAIAIGLARPELGQHLLGQSEKREAMVTDVERVDFCGRSSRDTFTLEWTEEGAQRSETLGRCGDPWQVGDTVEVWSTDGAPQTEPPTATRLVLGGLLLALALVAGLCVRALARQRRIFSAALAGAWQPITCPTLGSPGHPGFRILDAPEPVRPDRIGRGREIHTGLARGGREEQMPGTLFLDSIKRGKPRRLALWSGADGTRLWRWHG